jgi:3-oxoacyl-[acyl-carrier protein] reductase
MDLGLTERTYVVSGASRGLGFAVAAALHAEGASVVLASRQAEAVQAAADRLGDGRAVAVGVDLTDADAADRLVDAARQRFGRLDGALCNTGGPARGRALDLGDDVWRGAFESAFLGPLRLARTVAGAVGPGGALLFVLSSSAKAPIPGLDTSNGLRPGLAMLVNSLADELGPRGVRVNAVLPGRIATARTREGDEASGDPEASRARAEAAIPLRRYGEPDELGRVGAFLLSPAASYITGTSIPVDGGLTRGV